MDTTSHVVFPTVPRPNPRARPDLLARLVGGQGPIALGGARGVGKSVELDRVARAYEAGGHGAAHRVTPGDVEREALRANGGGRGRPLLALDGAGLDGMPPRAYDFLRSLVDREAPGVALWLAGWRIVVALPAAVSFESDLAEALAGFRVETLGAVPVLPEHGDGWAEGRAFFAELLRAVGDARPPARYGDGQHPVDLVIDAGGGLPGRFGRVWGEALFRARVGCRAEPDVDDARKAVRDEAERVRRLLRPGDLDALAAAHGTDGLEVDPARRARLQAHGLLVEHGEAERARVFAAPLLRPFLDRRAPG